MVIMRIMVMVMIYITGSDCRYYNYCCYYYSENNSKKRSKNGRKVIELVIMIAMVLVMMMMMIVIKIIILFIILLSSSSLVFHLCFTAFVHLLPARERSAPPFSSCPLRIEIKEKNVYVFILYPSPCQLTFPSSRSAEETRRFRSLSPLSLRPSCERKPRVWIRKVGEEGKKEYKEEERKNVRGKKERM